MKTIVIGAGLSGLALANLLKRQGQEALILEKSKGLGGRLATRRIDQDKFDHGINYFDEKTHQKIMELFPFTQELWRQNEWGHYIQGGMSHLAKSLGQNLQIVKEVHINQIDKIQSGWRLHVLNSPQSYECHRLVLSAPLPQSAQLIKDVEPNLYDQISSVKYKKSILALIPNFPHQLPGVQMSQDLKGLAHQGCCWYLESEWVDQHFELSEKDILDYLSSIAPFKLPAAVQIKKWRYAEVINPLSTPYLTNSDQSLCIIGDGFGGQAIGALSSAELLFNQVLLNS